MVRFDGKHWIAKRTRAGPLRIYSYEHVTQQTSKNLGEYGILAIPNARPDEYRFEEFHDQGKNKGITDLLDGRVFYDYLRSIYFMKAQEVNTRSNGVPITFLVYNLPFGKNLNDKEAYQALIEANSFNSIVGITGPKCISNLEKALDKYPYLLGHLDFFVGYSSNTALYGANKKSMDFYNKNILNREFEHPLKNDKHKIGIISVSGGHRTPKGFLDYLGNGFSQTIGRSYVNIDLPLADNFIEDLRKSLRSSKHENLYMEPTIAESLRQIISIKIVDKFRK